MPRYPGGALHALSADLGKVVLLDVWATWCEPCRDALPTYQRLRDQYRARGLEVYAINVDEDPTQIPAFIEETRLDLPILIDKNAGVSERDLNVRVMPSTFLVDRRGALRFVHEGWADGLLPQYQAEIEQLLSEPLK